MAASKQHNMNNNKIGADPMQSRTLVVSTTPAHSPDFAQLFTKLFIQTILDSRIALTLGHYQPKKSSNLRAYLRSVTTKH
jgi:hypothetical protein